MNRRLREFFAKLPWLAYGLSLLGGLIFAWRTWSLAHRLTTMILDESMYIYKGYLFVTGQYAAYQDYGPLTNHMPLSFIIPGFVQAVFGPGMETARVFAFLVALVMLAGFWLAAFRLGGKWWAALIVWILALNPVWQEVFSQGLTQGVVNALIAWGFVLLLGEERKAWQVALSAGMLALAVMTRVNILPVLGLAVLYVFWQHGWRKGAAAALGGLVVGVTVMALFWPEVLKFLAGWIPEGLFGFVEPFRSPWSQQHVPEGFGYFPVAAWFRNPDSQQWSGVRALLEALNFNFIPFLVVAGTLVFWPKRHDWRDDYRRRLSVFLVVSWLLMAGLHAWVALSGKSCRFFCLSGYFTFFNFLALLLLPAAFPFWRKRPPLWRGVTGMVLLFGIISGAMYSAGLRPRQVFEWWYDLMNTPIPRISGGRIHWDERGLLLALFESKLKLSYSFLVEELPEYLYWVFLVLLVFGLSGLLYALVRKRIQPEVSWPWLGFALFLVLGLAFSPTELFRAGSAVQACEDSVISSHELAAGQLVEMIEPDSQVYWDLTSDMLLLYLPEVGIYPPQLNAKFNFVRQSEPEESDEIYRFGYWNEYLREQWLAEVDYVLIPGQYITDWEDELASGSWERAGVTAPYESCRARDTEVYVFVQEGIDD